MDENRLSGTARNPHGQTRTFGRRSAKLYGRGTSIDALMDTMHESLIGELDGVTLS
jgi:hypothetical protein